MEGGRERNGPVDGGRKRTRNGLRSIKQRESIAWLCAGMQSPIQLPGGHWVEQTVNEIYSWMTQALCAPSCGVTKVQPCVRGFLWVGGYSRSQSTAVVAKDVFVAGGEV